MYEQALKQFLSWLLVLCMVVGFLPAVHASGLRWEKTELTITAPLSDRPVQKDESTEYAPGETVRVSIVLDKPSTLEAGFSTMGIAFNRKAMDYRAELQAQQKGMEKIISARVLKAPMWRVFPPPTATFPPAMAMRMPGMRSGCWALLPMHRSSP